MIQPEQIGILRVVKGAAASVLLALIFNQAAMGAKELSRRTAWCESEITEALKDLADLGLIENFARYNGWALTPRARSLMLAGLVEGELPAGEGAASAAAEMSTAMQDSPGSSGSGPVEMRSESVGPSTSSMTSAWISDVWPPLAAVVSSNPCTCAMFG